MHSNIDYKIYQKKNIYIYRLQKGIPNYSMILCWDEFSQVYLASSIPQPMRIRVQIYLAYQNSYYRNLINYFIY